MQVGISLFQYYFAESLSPSLTTTRIFLTCATHFHQSIFFFSLARAFSVKHSQSVFEKISNRVSLEDVYIIKQRPTHSQVILHGNWTHFIWLYKSISQNGTDPSYIIASYIGSIYKFNCCIYSSIGKFFDDWIKDFEIQLSSTLKTD